MRNQIALTVGSYIGFSNEDKEKLLVKKIDGDNIHVYNRRFQESIISREELLQADRDEWYGVMVFNKVPMVVSPNMPTEKEKNCLWVKTTADNKLIKEFRRFTEGKWKAVDHTWR